MTLTSIINEATKLILSTVLWFPVLYFAWMIADIVWTSGNPKRRKSAGQRLTWGIIAMFVFISLGGIIAVLDQTFFFPNAVITTSPGATPQTQPQSGSGNSGTGGSNPATLKPCPTANGFQNAAYTGNCIPQQAPASGNGGVIAPPQTNDQINNKTYDPFKPPSGTYNL